MDEDAHAGQIVFTGHPTLTTANFLAFQRYTEQLGRDHEWQRVAEVAHVPAPEPSISTVVLRGRLLPIRRVVCVDATCARCILGPWSKRAIVVHSPEQGPAAAWAAYDACGDFMSPTAPSINTVFYVWRAWQQGSRRWRDPLAEPEPQRQAGREDEAARAPGFAGPNKVPRGRWLTAAGKAMLVHGPTSDRMCRDCFQERVCQ